MKNLLKNRKGFTLTEILLVVAIVVILSGATVIGVASWVNSAQATASKAKNDSANFEADAVLEVNKKKGYVNSEAVETTKLETGDNNGEGQQDGDKTDGDKTDGDKTDGDKTDGDKTDGDKTDGDKTDGDKTDGDKTDGDNSSSNSHIDKTFTSSTPGKCAPGSSMSTTPNVTHDVKYVWNASRNDNDLIPQNTKITTTGTISSTNGKIEQAIIVVPSGTTSVTAGDWRYTVEKIDDTHWKIWYSAGKSDEGHYQYNAPFTSMSYTINEEYTDPNLTASPSAIYISEYSTSK